MKITPKNNSVKKHQMGGQMEQSAPVQDPAMQEGAPAEGATLEAAPEAGVEQDPIMMLGQMCAQALQSQDCQMAMQVCQAFLELLQQMQGGAPEEPQGEPVFRKGGTLVRRIKN